MVFSSVSSGAAGEPGGEIADGAMCTEQLINFRTNGTRFSKSDEAVGSRGLGKGPAWQIGKLVRNVEPGFVYSVRVRTCQPKDSPSI